MLLFTQKLHDAKSAFIAGSYRSVASEIMNHYRTDADGIADELLAVVNTDYNLQDCKDNPELKKAFESLVRAFRDTGDGLPDGIGGKLVYKFSTTGGKDNKSRTVVVSYVTPEEMKIADEREAQDKAIKAERETQDKAIAEEKARIEMQSLTSLDVFLRIFGDAENTYPDHDMVKVVSAGLAWLQRDDTVSDADHVENINTATA